MNAEDDKISIFIIPGNASPGRALNWANHRQQTDYKRVACIIEIQPDAVHTNGIVSVATHWWAQQRSYFTRTPLPPCSFVVIVL
jgi:hypothetical protein